MKFILLTVLLAFNLSAFGIEKKIDTTVKNPPTAKPSSEPTQLDDLIRGELAALKAYDKVLADTKDEKLIRKLKAIRDDHEKAVSRLSKYVASKPELLEDTQSSGAWGTFVKTYIKGATLVGNVAALSALKQGEEHGIEEYKEALNDDTIGADLKKTIKNELLPSQKKHIETLNTFM